MYSGKISLDLGIIISILVGVVLPIVLAVLSPIIELAIKPKAYLVISDIHINKENYYMSSEERAYGIKATVANKGKKTCLNPTATFEIKDSSEKSPLLLYINFEDVNGEIRPTDERPEHHSMGNESYAWKIGNRYMKTIEKLRKDDTADLIYPYDEFGEGSVGVIGNQDTVIYSTQVLVKLEKSVEYTVTIIVKGDDSDGCTVTAKKQEKIKV